MRMLSPSDLLRADLQFVGVLDNQALCADLERELFLGSSQVEGSLGYHFSTRSIMPRRAPLVSETRRLGWSGSRSARASTTQSVSALLVRAVGGLKDSQRPMAPA